MNKKNYFETLSKCVADRVSIYEPKTTVKYDLDFSSLYVVFPPERSLLTSYVLNDISKVGGEISVGYYGDHLEVTVHVLYCE